MVQMSAIDENTDGTQIMTRLTNLRAVLVHPLPPLGTTVFTSNPFCCDGIRILCKFPGGVDDYAGIRNYTWDLRTNIP
jgi:hypothetical protein